VKLRAVAGYESCLLAAEASLLQPGPAPDASRCAARLEQRFERAERFGVGLCASEGDQAAIQAAAQAHVAALDSALAPPPLLLRGRDVVPYRPSVCRAAKLRAVGAHLACRFRFHAAEVWRGRAAEPGRCDAKLSAKLARAEARAEGSCPTQGDASALQQMDGAHVGAVLNALGGPAPLCGNGIVGADETCDGPELGGSDCAQLGYAGGGSLTCDEFCRFDASGCIP
jgi:hypothetical protein